MVQIYYSMFRAVFWVVLPCKMTTEDSSEHHTRRRENLKSHIITAFLNNVRKVC
jgi:hypothetical protein